MILLKRALALASLVILSSTLQTCSTEPENPGQCALKCGKAIIAPADYKIEKMTDDVNYRCTQAASLGNQSARTTVKFKITKKVQTGSGSTDAVTSVPNVSISPVAIGLVDEKEGKEPYLGIVTPESDFCSDACGVVTLRVATICPSQEQSEVSVGITSGALTTETPMRITMQAFTKDDTTKDAP